MKIRVLPESLANLIAAGEVVERPASVVKELLENSLDAGSREIRVEIHEAGFRSIRIADDGSGMLPEDARLAFQRHATSKITVPEDLDKILTLGFRGEALPSIAAVSRLELLTRPADQAAGTRIMIEGGILQSQAEAGCAAGTAITVNDLFFNTPARRKFMKSPATEQAHVIQAVELAAIAHPEVRFTLTVDSRQVFQCPETPELPERLAAIYGKSLPKDLVAVEREAGGVWIRGLIAGPSSTRQTRQGMLFFINQRPVEHRGMTHAVMEAYRTLIPDNRFPNCFLFLTMPPDLVDVNVHPAKREVRLRDEHAVHQLVFSAVKAALAQAELARFSGLPAEPSAAAPQTGGQAWSPGRVRESIAAYSLRAPSAEGKFNFSYATSRSETMSPALEIQAGNESGQSDHAVQILGMVGRTYIAGQDTQGFFLIDQHAGHERLLYEKFREWPAQVPRQSLLLPLTFEATPGQAAWLTEALPMFNRLGFEIAAFGGNTFVLNTQPEFYEKTDLVRVVTEMTEWAMETGRAPEAEFRDHLMKRLACHAAVKAHDRLQPEAQLKLVDQLLAFPGPAVCPHGRPFLFRISWNELDHIFKRPAEA